MILQSELQLFEVSRLEAELVPPVIARNRKAVDRVIRWIHEYLAKPHPELGRPGPVCPFVPTAMEKKLLHLAVYEGTAITGDAIRDILLEMLDCFLDMEPRIGNNAQFKAFLLLFPNIPGNKSHDLVEMAQQDLRFTFVPKGLMVGEFHPGPPDKAGLWNKQFRPLNCPIPMLAIRHMVPTDVLFLKDEHSLITEYLKIFGDMVPAKFRNYIEEAAERFGFDLPDQKPTQPSASSVIYHLEKAGIPYKTHRHSLCQNTIHRPEDFAKALDYDVQRISKALFLKEVEGDRYAIAVLPATRNADLEKLAREMDVGQLREGTPEELAQVVGHETLSVNPIGVPGVQAFLDDSLMDKPTVLIGSGVERMEIELAPLDLANLSKARILTFSF